MNEAGRGAKLRGIGNHLAPARFVAFLILLPAAFFTCRDLVPGSGWQDTLVVSFDIAALVFLLSLIPLFGDTSVDSMREHARANDANRELILTVTLVLTGAIMAAIASQLRPAQDGDPLALAKLLATLAIAWLFANMMCTLHYAHTWYSAAPDGGGDTGGLEFPATKTPTYLDFTYYSLTIGMTFQTSDVTTTSAEMRTITLLHAAAAFVFNIGIIAFTINGLGG